MVSCWYANKFRTYVPELEKVLLEMKLELSNRIFSSQIFEMASEKTIYIKVCLTPFEIFASVAKFVNVHKLSVFVIRCDHVNISMFLSCACAHIQKQPLERFSRKRHS